MLLEQKNQKEGWALYNRRIWLRKLLNAGFRLRRTNGGHARYTCNTINIDVPIHQRELSHTVVASLRRAIRLTGCQAR